MQVLNKQLNHNIRHTHIDNFLFHRFQTYSHIKMSGINIQNRMKQDGIRFFTAYYSLISVINIENRTKWSLRSSFLPKTFTFCHTSNDQNYFFFFYEMTKTSSRSSNFSHQVCCLRPPQIAQLPLPGHKVTLCFSFFNQKCSCFYKKEMTKFYTDLVATSLLEQRSEQTTHKERKLIQQQKLKESFVKVLLSGFRYKVLHPLTHLSFGCLHLLAIIFTH